jgi:16S rRNA (adenine(1408)-N(1))-methyltransferase
MAESSLRAARPERRGGLPNALFLVAAAERLPAELRGRVDELTMVFPWGSLLRAALALDDAAFASHGIAGVLADEASLRILVSIDPRDGLALDPLDTAHEPALSSRWGAFGLELAAFAPATRGELAESGSTWARRLGAGRDRAAWRIELRAVRGAARGPDPARRAATMGDLASRG